MAAEARPLGRAPFSATGRSFSVPRATVDSSGLMPIVWQIRDGLVWLTTTDPWTMEDWRGAATAFLAHPDFRPGMGTINDRRQGRAPSTREVKAMLDFVQVQRSAVGTARWTAVTTDNTSYGMVRMAQVLFEESSVRLGVFHSLEDAEAWVREGQDAIGKRHSRG